MLFFNANNRYVNFGNIPLPTGTAFSISLWLIKDGATNAQDERVFSKESSGFDQQFAVNTTNQGGTNTGIQVRLQTTVGGTLSQNSDIRFGFNQLVHVCVTYDGSNVRLYINNQLSNTWAKTGNIVNSNNILCIGNRALDQARQYRGRVFDARLYDVTLGPEQVEEIFITRGEDNIHDGLFFRAPLDGYPQGTAATGANTVREITNGRHGTPLNSPVYEDKRYN